MPTDNLKQLKKEIAEQALRPCYILHGEESYLREYYLQKLAACVYPTPETAAELTVLRGGRFQGEDLRNALESVSLLSERKLVVVRDLDIAKPDAKVRDAIESLYIPEDVTLVFVYDTLEFKPDKRTKCYKQVNTLSLTVELARQSETDLLPWLKRRFAALGKQIETADARYLLFLCGSLMTNLVNEVAKIACYANGPAVTRADIDAVAAPVAETVVFQLTDELSAGHYDSAAARLRALLEAREEPVMLLGLLGRQIRGIYLAKLAMAARRDERFVAAAMGYKSSYPARKLMEPARRFSLAWCRRAVRLCSETDQQLKGIRLGRDDALTLLLARLAIL